MQPLITFARPQLATADHDIMLEMLVKYVSSHLLHRYLCSFNISDSPCRLFFFFSVRCKFSRVACFFRYRQFAGAQWPMYPGYYAPCY